jgi:hypothetical protein
LPIAAIRNIFRSTRKKPDITAKGLLFDLAHTGDEVSLSTLRLHYAAMVFMPGTHAIHLY